MQSFSIFLLNPEKTCMVYKRNLKNNEHFHHIVRRLTIFYSYTKEISNDTAVGTLAPRSEHRRLPSKDHTESKPSPNPSSHVTYNVDQYPENDVNPFEIERRRTHKPLLLLSRSQTEAWPGLLPPSL